MAQDPVVPPLPEEDELLVVPVPPVEELVLDVEATVPLDDAVADWLAP